MDTKNTKNVKPKCVDKRITRTLDRLTIKSLGRIEGDNVIWRNQVKEVVKKTTG
jgi:hypothetical protein